ncbi:MAG: hypothetical protein IJ735_01785 [Clostridia bacterium]|nr:hypothetical protein [Clostridia bacterium]
MNKNLDELSRRAWAEGFSSLDEYLVYCEVYDIVKKMNVALDRAFLPDELSKYCDSVNEAFFPKKQ